MSFHMESLTTRQRQLNLIESFQIQASASKSTPLSILPLVVVLKLSELLPKSEKLRSQNQNEWTNETYTYSLSLSLFYFHSLSLSHSLIREATFTRRTQCILGWITSCEFEKIISIFRVLFQFCYCLRIHVTALVSFAFRQVQDCNWLSASSSSLLHLPLLSYCHIIYAILSFIQKSLSLSLSHYRVLSLSVSLATLTCNECFIKEISLACLSLFLLVRLPFFFICDVLFFSLVLPSLFYGFCCPYFYLPSRLTGWLL